MITAETRIPPNTEKKLLFFIMRTYLFPFLCDKFRGRAAYGRALPESGFSYYTILTIFLQLNISFL